MRAQDEYLDHLAQVPLFSACNRKDLKLLAKASDEVEVKAGKVLVREGKPGHQFFLIVDGTASVQHGGQTIAELGPGQFFGELALLDHEPRNADVVADTDMTLVVLGQREFSGVLDEVPAMAHKLLAALAKRIRAADAARPGIR